MSKKVSITRITLETKDGKMVELSLDEARELHAQLAELFASKTVCIPSPPVIIDRDYFRPRPYWLQQTWCDSNSVGQITAGGTSMRTRGASGLAVTYSGNGVE